MSERRRLRLAANRIGSIAARALARHQTRAGAVVAVFGRTAYLQFETGLLCLAGTEDAIGPLTLTTDRAGPLTRLLGTGQRVHVHDGLLSVGPALVIELDSASPWHPDPWPPPPDPMQLTAALGCLRRHVPPTVLATGLGAHVTGCVRPAPTNRVAHHARDAIAAGRAELVCRDDAEFVWARELVGLGPGLTPSGDDCLGGILLALHAIGERHIAERLWARIGIPARTRTHAISCALLAAAARGLGSARVHRFLRILMLGADPVPALEDLARMGQSSGWDTLVGLVMVLEGFALQNRRQAA